MDVATDRPRLLRKLRHRFDLPATEQATLARLLGANTRRLRHRATLVDDGAAPSEISVILEGWCCRAIDVDGRRYIVGFCLPGDVCEFDAFVMDGMDGRISAIGDVRVATISRDGLEHISRSCPQLGRSLWWEALATATIQRQWTVNLARRGAARRLAHLLCELFVRLDAVDLVEPDSSCVMPASQTELGDALGMTSEHVNRTLQDLRASKLVALVERRLTVLDFDRLSEVAGFRPSYLLVTNAAPRRRGPTLRQ